MKKILFSSITMLLCLSLLGCGAEHTDRENIPPASAPPPTVDTQETWETEQQAPALISPEKEEIAGGSVIKDPPTVPGLQEGRPSTFSIRYLDVGQADAALVECDGRYMLIDGGNAEDSSLIYTVLKKEEAGHLDIVVGTHAHEDHIGGLSGAFHYATADLTLCPVTEYDSEAFQDFQTNADQKGGGITVPSVGDCYTLGSAEVEILGVNDGDDTNDTSIVLRITYGDTSFLFTGDAQREAEQAILNREGALSSTVLKVGHHGSDTSTTYPFLREVMPQYAVISVGEGNSYGHPTDDTLSRLRDAGVTVFRTDLNGDIFVTSDGQAVSISTEKTAAAEDMMVPGGIAPDPGPEVPEVPKEAESAAPVEMEYVVNLNSKKFHIPSCSSVKNMKESNKLPLRGTREALIAQGYAPCGSCQP